MSWPRPIWNQLKNLTADELIHALERDGWRRRRSKGAIFVYEHPDGLQASGHYHPRKTFGSGLLKALLKDIGWTEADLRRLKLIR
ncbi:MAG: type II toxin-antitoxin system HicA family toxin [Candidatus Bipolaricaulota bacterium]|nr:type II toxin-antitoxin system HicA family toxin [Candidatus Bipolaricaulota bacterium]MDW8110210.1 type II toxin-antitoxin system HicA family toxin [Candidatus Bipolaricaulota bacterium]MDW8328890.1 type II toxin-antitoxin system HicA family toxin [Candidatus Bipolaricaulota bacterium]